METEAYIKLPISKHWVDLFQSDPLIIVLAGVFLIVGFLAISKHREKFKSFAHPFAWLAENYLWVILPLGAFAIGFAIYEWIWQILPKVGEIINRLKPAKQSPDEIQSLAYAIGALLAAVALSATIPFQLIKVWVNERLAKTTEQGHMTDRITKAVEQLGAEKTVWKDGDQQSVPNLEVRLGGIYALARVAKDSPRDHISIMEILCAYVRENFPKDTAAQNSKRDLGEFPRQYEYSDPEEKSSMTTYVFNQLSSRQLKIKQLYGTFGSGSLKNWSESFRPRSDLQAIIRVIGERANKEVEKNYKYGEQIYNFGFRLNLANSNLQGVDFEMLDFAGALFSGSALDGAQFRKTILDDAFFTGVSVCGADFYDLKMNIVVFSDCQMELCQLKNVGITNSKIYRANLSGSFLTNVRFLKTELHQVSIEGGTIAECLLIGGYTIDDDLPLIDNINAFGVSFKQVGIAQLDFRSFNNVTPDLADESSFVIDESVINFPETVLGEQILIASTSTEEFEAKWQAAKAVANL